ncbi:hypothetical protein AA0121_g13233 [Alternaria tenuissima]|nr:hypothetical protein AA0121_g13233 [Alternaria tenuissima]
MTPPILDSGLTHPHNDHCPQISFKDGSHDVVDSNCQEVLIIAVDLGITSTKVAYARVSRGDSGEEVNTSEVKCIGNYPGDQEGRYHVPTELLYDDKSKPESTSPSAAKQYWGYEVEAELNNTKARQDETELPARLKTNLTSEKDADDDRGKLRSKLEALRDQGVTVGNTDICKHYLTHLLDHTKTQLVHSKELEKHVPIKFVLCVPDVWPVTARQVMQAALGEAVKDVGFSERAEDDFCDLDRVSESEAAAAWVFAWPNMETLYPGETVVVLDAGGGTVKAATYVCLESDPVLLERVIEPCSRSCGASRIDEECQETLTKKLMGATYSFDDGRSLASIVKTSMTKSRYNKQNFRVQKKKDASYGFAIPNLVQNIKKGFYTNVLALKQKDMEKIFEPSLVGAAEVLQNQLELAKNKNRPVHMVLLVGAFSESPALRKHIRDILEHQDRKIGLVTPSDPSYAVVKESKRRSTRSSRYLGGYQTG